MRARWIPIGASCSTTTRFQRARKVGVGSVGTEAMMVLLMGDREDDPLFLQIKEANTSVLAPYAGASEYEHQGASAWCTANASCRRRATPSGMGHRAGERRHEFYVRWLRDMKGSAAVETMPPERLALYGYRGATLARARAHRRRGKDHRLSRRRPHLRPCTRTLRHGLRRTNDADYAAFTQAADEHVIEVERGVWVSAAGRVVLEHLRVATLGARGRVHQPQLGEPLGRVNRPPVKNLSSLTTNTRRLIV